jgi:hypothetical protein
LDTMTDYGRSTVASLRQLLKDRGIPSTGLTRKIQIVEKLEEWDRRDENAPVLAEVESEPEPEPEPAPVAVQLEETPADEGDPDNERAHGE